VLEKLKQLGLTSYEAQAYLSLLKLGDAEANEIAVDAAIPMGRIYNVLSSLEEKRLLRAQETRPKKYSGVEPSTAMERLSELRKEELKQEASQIETLANDLIFRLSDVKVNKPEKTFWTVAIGDESQELVRESIQGAKEEILFFMASKMTAERVKREILNEKYSGIMDSILETVKRGVEVRVILNNEVDMCVLEEYPSVKELMTRLGDGFECRLAAIPSTAFDIIDMETVLLKMVNPLNPEELFAVVNVRDGKFAGELRKKFFTLWETADCCDEMETTPRK
jgi:sugar-specific transcriptional regulator TrmB